MREQEIKSIKKTKSINYNNALKLVCNISLEVDGWNEDKEVSSSKNKYENVALF